LAGALLGVGMVLLVKIAGLREAATRPALTWQAQHPPSFHAALLVMLFLIAMTFEPMYPLAAFGFATAKATLNLTAVTLTAALHHR
jgi:hypothetical protein